MQFEIVCPLLFSPMRKDPRSLFPPKLIDSLVLSLRVGHTGLVHCMHSFWIQLFSPQCEDSVLFLLRLGTLGVILFPPPYR